MARRALAFLLLAAAATVALAAEPTTKETACILTVPIEQKQSPFALVGAVTKPFNATVTPIKAAATGNLHLRLATANGACPPASAWADADAAAELLSGASLVQPTSAEGIKLLPEKIRAAVKSDESGDELATYTLTGFTFGLESNGPFGSGAVASPAAASASAVEASGSTDAEVVVLKGGLVIDSPLTGERTADLKGVAQNVTFASGAAPTTASGGGGKKKALGIKLSDVKWSLVVSPKTTPGIHFTEAKVGIEGDIVASVADPAAAAKEVAAKDLRLRCTSRALGPVIEGGEDAKADLIKRQKRVTGGCPDDAAVGGGKVKAAVAEAEADKASAVDAAAAGGGGEGEGESEVDKAVREAYGSGADRAMASLSSAVVAGVVGLVAAAAW
jgi:hypothetical protein